jgi:hypothetical protein
MTVTIKLSLDLEKSLTEKAKAKGTDVEGYVHALIQRDALHQKTLGEILAPFRQEVRDSGCSVGELESLLEEAILETRRQLDRQHVCEFNSSDTPLRLNAK